jgi:hypothetical protein
LKTIKIITTIEEQLLLEQLEIILKTSKKDWFTDLNSAEREEIELGLKQAVNEEFISH